MLECLVSTLVEFCTVLFLKQYIIKKYKLGNVVCVKAVVVGEADDAGDENKMKRCSKKQWCKQSRQGNI